MQLTDSTTLTIMYMAVSMDTNIVPTVPSGFSRVPLSPPSISPVFLSPAEGKSTQHGCSYQKYKVAVLQGN